MTGTIVWISGLPASGKTTLAWRLRDRLARDGTRPIVLDGDDLRAAMVPTPGYSTEERRGFYATLASLAALLAAQQFDVVVAATANRREFRNVAREKAHRFIEVYVSAPLEECARRDPKGLYARANSDRSILLPGVSEPYEIPESPDVVASGGFDDGAVERIARLLSKGSADSSIKIPK